MIRDFLQAWMHRWHSLQRFLSITMRAFTVSSPSGWLQKAYQVAHKSVSPHESQGIFSELP
jgi:hypothetical protein